MATSQQYTLENSVAGHKSANIAIGAASAGATLPTSSTLVGFSCTSACHFRTGNGAQTAVATDPMLTPGMGLLVLNIPTFHNNVAVIQDSATGQFNFFPVYED